MHHFVTEMCTHMHISVTKWCIVGCGSDTLWDLCNWSIGIIYLTYPQTSDIRCTLVGNKIVDHQDIVGASPVSAASTTSSFSISHLASINCAKKTARWDKKHLSFGIWCNLYWRFDGNLVQLEALYMSVCIRIKCTDKYLHSNMFLVHVYILYFILYIESHLYEYTVYLRTRFIVIWLRATFSNEWKYIWTWLRCMSFHTWVSLVKNIYIPNESINHAFCHAANVLKVF